MDTDNGKLSLKYTNNVKISVRTYDISIMKKVCGEVGAFPVFQKVVAKWDFVAKWGVAKWAQGLYSCIFSYFVFRFE